MAESLHILLGTSACLHVRSGYVTQVNEPWPVGLLFFFQPKSIDIFLILYEVMFWYSLEVSHPGRVPTMFGYLSCLKLLQCNWDFTGKASFVECICSLLKPYQTLGMLACLVFAVYIPYIISLKVWIC